MTDAAPSRLYRITIRNAARPSEPPETYTDRFKDEAQARDLLRRRGWAVDELIALPESHETAHGAAGERDGPYSRTEAAPSKGDAIVSGSHGSPSSRFERPRMYRVLAQDNANPSGPPAVFTGKFRDEAEIHNTLTRHGMRLIEFTEITPGSINTSNPPGRGFQRGLSLSLASGVLFTIKLAFFSAFLLFLYKVLPGFLLLIYIVCCFRGF